MKKKKALLMLLIFFLIPTSIYSISRNQMLKGITIVLDAGHGGKDQGASYEQTYEAPINLKITLKLKKQLETLGASIVLTRQDENDLSDELSTNKKRDDMKKRIQIINDEKNDLLISIHMNKYQSETVNGIHVYYQTQNESSQVLAQSIQYQINEKFNQSKQIKTANFYLLENSRLPSILIECGFLSNEQDRHNLQDEHYQDKLVATIVEGVLLYYKEKGFI
ncbi:MAG: N-acetylmuramoyl-L-alanine amidase [Traorella sp.]